MVGALGVLAVRARAILGAVELPDVRIVVGGGLDEYAVDDLVRSAAPLDIHAVGTRVGVSADAPFLDSAYKMVQYDGRPVMKLNRVRNRPPAGAAPPTPVGGPVGRRRVRSAPPVGAARAMRRYSARGTLGTAPF